MKVYTSSRNRANRAAKLMRLFGLFLAVGILIVGGMYIYLLVKVNSPAFDVSDLQEFKISQGEGLSLISNRLEQEGIITSATIFKIYAVMRNLSGDIKAGSYVLDGSSDMKDILSHLTNTTAGGDEVVVTLPEGKMLRDFVKILVEKNIINDSEIFYVAQQNYRDTGSGLFDDKPKSAGLEGYLFPDTYFFSKNSEVGDVINKILGNFEDKLNHDLRSEISRQNKTIFEILIMASLIEGEVGRNISQGGSLTEADLAKLSEERRLVAGVFYNRLSVNHVLQSDATLKYITGENKTRASFKDTQIDHFYNTYKYRGLPPGPINNPSLDSILAAVFPADTDYFYFLSKPSGEAVFTRTLEEHNLNKARFLQ